MRTFKRAVLVAALSVSALAASSSAALAVDTINGAGAVTFTANGGADFSVGTIPVHCNTAQVTANITAATLPPAKVYAIRMINTGCSAFGFSATVNCANPSGTLTVSDVTSATTATGSVNISNGACTINVAGCTVTAPSGSSVTAPGNLVSEGPATIVVGSGSGVTGVPYTSSGISCGFFGVSSSGTATYSTGGGNLTYVQTAGTAVNVGI